MWTFGYGSVFGSLASSWHDDLSIPVQHSPVRPTNYLALCKQQVRETTRPIVSLADPLSCHNRWRQRFNYPRNVSIHPQQGAPPHSCPNPHNQDRVSGFPRFSWHPRKKSSKWASRCRPSCQCLLCGESELAWQGSVRAACARHGTLVFSEPSNNALLLRYLINEHIGWAYVRVCQNGSNVTTWNDFIKTPVQICGQGWYKPNCFTNEISSRCVHLFNPKPLA